MPKTSAKDKVQVMAAKGPHASSLSQKLKSKQSKAAKHEVVIARAGTGKTFTQIVGVGHVFGDDTLWTDICLKVTDTPDGIVPSEAQKLIWDAMALSSDAKTVTYCAFNKSIVTEFEEEWGWMQKRLQELGVNLQFATVNALGSRIITQAYGFKKANDWHAVNLLEKVTGKDSRELRRKSPTAVNAVKNLVGLCKLNLIGWTEEDGFNSESICDEDLDQLCNHHDIELNGSRRKVFDYTKAILDLCLKVDDNKEIDWNDQNWLPIVLNLPIPKVDLLLVDEAQDLPRVRQEFARKMGRRLIVVGDDRQAIYGFAGADTDSIPRLMNLLNVKEPLKLTETRRCGKAIVAEAQKIVPDFTAHEDNPKGVILTDTTETYGARAEDGDMVLCRVNAPMISQALQFIKDGRKATIRGRDFGKSLVKFVEKQKASDVSDLIQKVSDWRELESQKENSKKFPSEAKLIGIQDKAECIMAFCNNAITVKDVTDKIDLVFSGKQCPKCEQRFNDEVLICYKCKCGTKTPEGIQFSSVHRAKGLESDRVFILKVKGADMPHPMAKSAWQVGQEMNLKYVAITRAKQELVYVYDA